MCVLFYFEENIPKIKFNVYEFRTLIVYIYNKLRNYKLQIWYLISFLKKSYFIVCGTEKNRSWFGANNQLWAPAKKIDIIKTSVDTITIGDYIRREKKWKFAKVERTWDRK